MLVGAASRWQSALRGKRGHMQGKELGINLLYSSPLNEAKI
jgi:hypothetical protein